MASCGNDTASKPAIDSLADSAAADLNALNEKIRKDPDNLDLYNTRAKLHMARKDWQSALSDVDRILSRDSSKAEYLLTAADVYFFTGKVKRTQQVLSHAVSIAPDNIDINLRYAQLLHYLTKYEEEIKILDHVLEKDIHNAQAYFMKGMVFKELGDTTNAVSSMQTAVEQDPDYYNAYIQLGLLHAVKKNPLAVQYYLNALKVQPKSVEAMYHLGMFYQETEDYNRALETYTTLLTVNPKHFDAHFNMGMIHAVKLGKGNVTMVRKGMEYFNSCIQDEPQNPRGYYGRGYCHEALGDVTNAEKDYKKALEVDPQYTNAAIALENLGK
ncbi:MAG: hypothetical protein Fur0041_06900 [Bacteroidia bacterium]